MLSYPMFLPIFLGVFSIGASQTAEVKNSDEFVRTQSAIPKYVEFVYPSPIHLGSNKKFM